MADLTNILGPYASSPDASAAASAFDTSRTRDEFIQKLNKLNLPDEVKANLYDKAAPTWGKKDAPPMAGDIPGMRGAQLNGPSTKLGTAASDMETYGTQGNYGPKSEGLVNLRAGTDYINKLGDQLDSIVNVPQFLRVSKGGKIAKLEEGFTTGTADAASGFTTPGQLGLMAAMTAAPAAIGGMIGGAPGAAVGKLISIGSSIAFGTLSLTDAINSSKEIRHAWADGDYNRAGYLLGHLIVSAKVAYDSYGHALKLGKGSPQPLPPEQPKGLGPGAPLESPNFTRTESGPATYTGNTPPKMVEAGADQLGVNKINPAEYVPSGPITDEPIRPPLAGQFTPPSGSMAGGPIVPPLTGPGRPTPGQPIPPPNVVTASEWTPSTPGQAGPIRPPLAGQFTPPPPGSMESGPVRPPLRPEHQAIADEATSAANVVRQLQESRNADPAFTLSLLHKDNTELAHLGSQLESLIEKAGASDHPDAPRAVESFKNALNAVKAVIDFKQSGQPLPEFMKPKQIAAGPPEFVYQGVRANRIGKGSSGWWTRSIEEAKSFANREGKDGEILRAKVEDFPEHAFSDANGDVIPQENFWKTHNQIEVDPSRYETIKPSGDNGLSFQKPKPPVVTYDPDHPTTDMVVGDTVKLPSKVNPDSITEHAMALVPDVFNSFRYQSDSQPRMEDPNYSNGLIYKIKTQPVVEQFLQPGIWHGEGVPGVDPRGVVEVGNHKSEALLQSREQYRKMLDTNGTLKQFPMARLYSQFIDALPSRARSLGMSRTQVEKLIADAKDPNTDTKLPLLVTIRKTILDDSQKWDMLADANVPTANPAKDVQQAFHDSKKLVPNAISELTTDEEGNVSGLDKVARNMIEQMTPNERGKWLITGTNEPNQAMMRRAALGVAYHGYNSTELAEQAAENTKDTSKKITNGLMAAAPAMAQIRDYAEANGLSLGRTTEGDHTTGDDIGQAVAKIKNFKGKTMARMTSELNTQKSLTEEPVVSEIAKTLLNNRNSAANVQAFIEKYASLVMDEKNSEDAANSPMHAAMGGDPFIPKTKLELVQEASKFVDQKVAEDRAQAKADKAAKKEKAMSAGAGEVSASQPVRYEKTPAGMQGSLLDEGFDQGDKSAKTAYEQEIENARQAADLKAKAVEGKIADKNLKQKLTNEFNAPMTGGKKNAPPKSMDMFNYRPEKNPGQGEFDLEAEDNHELVTTILDNLKKNKAIAAGQSAGSLFPELTEDTQGTLFSKQVKDLVKPVSMKDASGKERPIESVLQDLKYRVYKTGDGPARIYMNNAAQAAIRAAFIDMGVWSKDTEWTNGFHTKTNGVNYLTQYMNNVINDAPPEAQKPVMEFIKAITGANSKDGVVFVDVGANAENSFGGLRQVLSHELTHAAMFKALGREGLEGFEKSSDFKSFLAEPGMDNSMKIVATLYKDRGYSGTASILHELLADWSSGISDVPRFQRHFATKINSSFFGPDRAVSAKEAGAIYDNAAIGFVKAMVEHFGADKVMEATKPAKIAQKVKAWGPSAAPPGPMSLFTGK